MNEIFLEDRGLQKNYKCNENTMVGERDSGFKGHLYLPRDLAQVMSLSGSEGQSPQSL